jgi:hypothetical protein
MQAHRKLKMPLMKFNRSIFTSQNAKVLFPLANFTTNKDYADKSTNKKALSTVYTTPDW